MKSKQSQDHDNIKIVATNKKAFHDYFILEKLEVGIAMLGTELRPCREGKVNLKEAWVEVENNQMWLVGCHIGSNPFANRFDHDPLRKRRLLAHKKQIIKWGQKAETSGIAIIPLKMYFRNGKLKLEIGLAKGKKQYDKRETIAKKDLKRELEREMSGRK